MAAVRLHPRRGKVDDDQPGLDGGSDDEDASRTAALAAFVREGQSRDLRWGRAWVQLVQGHATRDPRLCAS
eukprot:10536477-Heterocapsa_arctica.AAC.1